MAIAAGVVAVGSAVYSADRQGKASRAQKRAQEQANAVEKRMSQIANQRSRREAAAAASAAMASNIAQSQGYGGGGLGSSLYGANTSIASSLSSQIGFSNTQLASGQARTRALQHGANQAGKYNTQASWGGAVGGAAASVGTLIGTPSPKQTPTITSGTVGIAARTDAWSYSPRSGMLDGMTNYGSYS